jgi:YbbR domain-containing protein
VTEPLTINIKDAPADLVIIDGSQKLKVTLSTSGFELLNYYFKPASRRKVDISLEEVPLHKDSESTYSFSISYAKEKVANYLTIEPNEVSFDESRISINMEQLDSIRVKVQPNIDMTYEKQYNRHGKIQIKPDSVTIYGPKNKLATIDNIYTESISLKNVNSNIDINVPLHIDEMLKTNNKEVNIKINVEKYTEAIANVKINNNFNKKLRLFPDKVKVRYIVSLTDYNIIKDNSFIISIDTADISTENNFLPIYLIDYPSNTRITSIEPKEVEYIIIDENEN